MSNPIDYSQGIYDAKKLGTPRMLILGAQHMFAMFGATVLVPLLTGLSVSTTLLCAGEQRHQHGGSEHGEHVLHAQDEHPARTQLARVVNALGVIDLFTHGFCIPPASTQKKRHCRDERQCLLNWEQ